MEIGLAWNVKKRLYGHRSSSATNALFGLVKGQTLTLPLDERLEPNQVIIYRMHEFRRSA